MSACWALAWLASKFDFQKCLSWVLAWANDKGTNCGTLHHAPRKAMFEGNGPLWKLLGVDLPFKDLCMKYSWDGDHIFSLLLGVWGCAFHVLKTKTVGWNLSVTQALWHSFIGYSLRCSISVCFSAGAYVVGGSFPPYFEAAAAASLWHHYVHEGYSSSPGRAAGNQLTTTQPGSWQENSLTPSQHSVRPKYQRITVWAPTAEPEVPAG